LRVRAATTASQARRTRARHHAMTLPPPPPAAGTELPDSPLLRSLASKQHTRTRACRGRYLRRESILSGLYVPLLGVMIHPLVLYRSGGALDGTVLSFLLSHTRSRRAISLIRIPSDTHHVQHPSIVGPTHHVHPDSRGTTTTRSCLLIYMHVHRYVCA
jgi:hypothetical protein